MHLHGYFLVLLLIFLTTSTINGSPKSKRTLTYIPPGGVIQMVMGVGLPLVVNNNAIIMGLVLKGVYSLPDNSTYYTNPNIVYARKRSISRWDIYDSFAHVFQDYGLGGKECVLRTICELAHTSLNTDIGILEEVIHTIFTPSATIDSSKRHSDNMYYAAEEQGRKNEKSCRFNYPNCPNHFAHLFTIFY